MDLFSLLILKALAELMMTFFQSLAVGLVSHQNSQGDSLVFSRNYTLRMVSSVETVLISSMRYFFFILGIFSGDSKGTRVVSGMLRAYPRQSPSFSSSSLSLLPMNFCLLSSEQMYRSLPIYSVKGRLFIFSFSLSLYFFLSLSLIYLFIYSPNLDINIIAITQYRLCCVSIIIYFVNISQPQPMIKGLIKKRNSHSDLNVEFISKQSTLPSYNGIWSTQQMFDSNHKKIEILKKYRRQIDLQLSEEFEAQNNKNQTSENTLKVKNSDSQKINASYKISESYKNIYEKKDCESAQPSLPAIPQNDQTEKCLKGNEPDSPILYFPKGRVTHMKIKRYSTLSAGEIGHLDCQ